MTTDYLGALFAGATEGYLIVCHNDFRSFPSFHISKLDEAKEFILSKSQNEDVYFGFGLQKEPPTSGRGKSDTVCVVGGLMMDLDLKSSEEGVHSKNDLLPETCEEVLAFLEEIGIPKPTAVRHSGNGIYCDWFFENVIVFEDDEDRKAVQALSKRLQRLIIVLAKKRKGWSFDSTHDLARVTRMPGSWNHKTTQLKPVCLLTMDESRRYTVAQLSAAVAELEQKHGLVQQRNKAATKMSRTPANDNDSNEPACSFEAVEAGCSWVQWCVENSAQLPEPDWYALASIAGKCSNGESIFHQLSKNDPRYDADQTAAKLEHALEASGPRTCDNIANELGFEGCKKCPFNERIASPISLARTKANVVGLIRQHAFDIKTGRYFDLVDGHVLSDKAFSQKFRHLTGRSTPHSLVIGSRFTRKVDRVDYLPGNTDLFTANEDAHQVLNLWRPGLLQPCEGDFSIIMEHPLFILPVESERKHFLDCLAHAVQNPAVKVRHVLLIIGFQGIGKSIMALLVKLLFGHDNVMIAENHDLNEGWTEAMSNKQVLFLEELGISEKRETYESLKRWITDEEVRVNEKQVPKHWARTPRLMLAFSNHEVPTALQERDRRWWVSRSPALPREPAYYERFVKEGLEQAPAFLHHLLYRDISHFKPSAPPPITEAKSNILMWSRPVVEQEIRLMMEQETFPFSHDLVTAEEVRSEVAIRLKGRYPSMAEVTRALKALGARTTEKQVRIGKGARVRPWAWRNQEEWAKATTDNIRAAFAPERELGATGT